jgi:hypothetical protein
MDSIPGPRRTCRHRSRLRPAVLACLIMLLGAAAPAAESRKECCLFACDPQHLWSRLHETLVVRTGPDGKRYGLDRVDPLYWDTTTHLLEGSSHTRALAVLDEFLSRHGETLIRDPLKRAFLQHDLWVLFDWAAQDRSWQQGRYEVAKQALRRRLATAIRRLGLTEQQIAQLPDNYARAQAEDLSVSLPQGLFLHGGDWVDLGSIAPIHTRDFGGRSVFRVLVRLPEGGQATLRYLEQLNSFVPPSREAAPPSEGTARFATDEAAPQFPIGTQWALVRQMCVIDTTGRVRPTAVIEGIQVRRYDVVRAGRMVGSQDDVLASQRTFEFGVSRARNGDLRRVLTGERDFVFVQFLSTGIDPFESSRSESREALDLGKLQVDVLKSCYICHSLSGIHSVNSYAGGFGPDSDRTPRLVSVDMNQAALEAAARWKERQPDFELLQQLWARAK